MIQQRPYRVGSMVRVHHVQGGYSLPEGLPEGAVVAVRAFEPGMRVVEWRQRRYQVPMACIESGFRVIVRWPPPR